MRSLQERRRRRASPQATYPNEINRVLIADFNVHHGNRFKTESFLQRAGKILRAAFIYGAGYCYNDHPSFNQYPSFLEE